MPGQGQVEDRNPGGKRNAACRDEQQAEPPAPPDPGIEQRVRQVNGGQRSGQLTPLFCGHPA
jgi:hypothetical protein